MSRVQTIKQLLKLANERQSVVIIIRYYSQTRKKFIIQRKWRTPAAFIQNWSCRQVQNLIDSKSIFFNSTKNARNTNSGKGMVNTGIEPK